MFGFRLGRNPQGIVTTTPRPIELVKKLAKRARTDKNPLGDVALTKGSTYENKANLAKPFFDKVITDYEGTRLGRQELDGEILQDNPNSLFKQEWFNRNRLEHVPPDMERVVVGVDPNVKEDIASDDCGIVTCGKKDVAGVPHYYVMADDTFSPETMDAWGRRVARTYFAQMADKVVAEVNNGGALVTKNIHAINPDIPVEEVHATRGKTKRAEPIATLFEQGRVHLCGKFPELETQCIDWDPTLEPKQQKSPDRMDAMVWAIAFLSGMKGRGMSQGRAQGR